MGTPSTMPRSTGAPRCEESRRITEMKTREMENKGWETAQCKREKKDRQINYVGGSKGWVLWVSCAYKKPLVRSTWPYVCVCI